MQVPRIPYILATAGHVDHGKSALVHALSGTDPDRLPEEKSRGITIDLGFAHLSLPSPPGAPLAEYEVGIIDVPGHEDFIKNMVAGVGSIDAALLVVAADDEWMPQTEEHLQILTYLGVSHGVVALSKVDLGEDEPAAVESIKRRLSTTPLAHARIIPTSVVSGRGIEQLKTALAELFSALPPQRDIHKPRLPVDRVFSIKGVGTVVTGTLTGGELRRGQSVCIRPGGAATRIRTVQTYGREVEVALPGSRVALNLPDLHAAKDRASRSLGTIARGDVVTLTELGEASAVLDAIISRLPSPASDSPGLTRPIRNYARVYLHHASAAVGARIYFYDVKALAVGEKALARLELESPLLAMTGDRLVLRDWPQQQTLGGGLVLDPDPPSIAGRRNPRLAAHRAMLSQRANSPMDPAVFALTQLARDGVVQRSTLLLRSRFGSEEIQAASQSLTHSGLLLATRDLLIERSLWETLTKRVIAAIDAHHRSHPELSGLPLTELTPLVLSTLASSQHALAAPLVDGLIQDMCRREFTRTSATLRRISHRPALPPRLQPPGQKLRLQLSTKPFDPPSRKELAASDLSHQALRFLIASGEVIDFGPEVVLSAEAYQRAIRLIRDHLSSAGSATVSELKGVLGATRRIMVPLLEKLDRDGITLREGDRRRLRTQMQDE